MHMNHNLMKNPVAKNKLRVLDESPAGDLLEEIQEQELQNEGFGGISPVVSAAVSAVSAISIAGTSIVSASATNPGRYCTWSAECSWSQKRCD
ncbi:MULTISPECIES: plantaricin C family lantibiotic [Bacillus cereus group]|nr:plantaricin C family lantibiotic [Bacillus toyonensis]MBR9663728.1 plantaricin C family lantibiotic [Bacillus cereus]MBU4642489.1 plantaricin C family lantibiotic [Bacillus toyonensis]TKH68695.1 plantaricin C family lantibiotic [Bacillus cereus]